MKQRGLLDRMGGRKFIVVQEGMWLTFWLGISGHLTADASMVIMGCVVAFTGADAFVTAKAIAGGVSLPSSPKAGAPPAATEEAM